MSPAYCGGGDPLELAQDPPELTSDAVPTIDDERPVASYKDWDGASTQIIVYRINNNQYKGRFARTRVEALAEVTKQYGTPVEINYIRGRAFFRVRKAK